MRALLDVNVLIALFDSNHAFHEQAHDWWEDHATSGWASCPLTENGAVRVMTSAGYSQRARFSPSEMTERLQTFVAHSDHVFWPDDLSLRDTDRFLMDKVHGARQVTDTYLLALAVKRRGRLVTFDRGVLTVTVRGAQRHHLVVVS